MSDKLYQQALDRANKMGCSVESMFADTLYEAFDQIELQEYAASFRRASADPELVEMAKMGMSDYVDQLKDNDCVYPCNINKEA